MIAEVLERMRFFEKKECIPLAVSKKVTEANKERYEGFCFNGVCYVPYSQSNIVLCSASEGISFSFTGCAMAYFEKAGKPYIAHISLDSCKEYDCRELWNVKVLAKEYQNPRLFYPASDRLLKSLYDIASKMRYSDGFEKHLNICGYINFDEQLFYSALIDFDGECVLAEESHYPFEGDYALLLPPFVKNYSIPVFQGK